MQGRIFGDHYLAINLTSITTVTFTSLTPCTITIISTPVQGPGTIPITFVLKNGSRVETLAREGEMALRLAQRSVGRKKACCKFSLK